MSRDDERFRVGGMFPTGVVHPVASESPPARAASTTPATARGVDLVLASDPPALSHREHYSASPGARDGTNCAIAPA